MPRVSKGTRTNRKLKPDTLPARYEPAFLQRMDGRTELARVLKQRFDCIAEDLGGIDALSNIKASLLERFIFLEGTLADIEYNMTAGADPKARAELIARWIQGCNAIAIRLFRHVGFEVHPPSLPLQPQHPRHAEIGSGGDTAPERAQEKPEGEHADA